MEQLTACPRSCGAQNESDLLFGEPRYDPDSIVKPGPPPDAIVTQESPPEKIVPTTPKQSILKTSGRRDDAGARAAHAPKDVRVAFDGHYDSQTEPSATGGDAASGQQDVKVVLVGHDDSQTASRASGHEEAERACPFAEHRLETVNEAFSPAISDVEVQVKHAEVSPCEESAMSMVETPTCNTGHRGLLERCQGLWYTEDGQKIGSIEGDEVVWCEQTFEGEPCKLLAISHASLTMQLDGETHTADVHEGPLEKIVWSDGEVWVRK